MENNNKFKICLGVICLLAVLVVTLITTVERDKISSFKIGFVGPLTGPGAAWGLEHKNMLELLKMEINSKGGVRGLPIEIIYEDGKCEGKESVTAAQKLINVDKVKSLLTSCSAASLAVAPLAREAKIPLFALWTTSPDFPSGDYIIRVSYSDSDTAKFMADLFNKRYRKIAVLTEENDYSVGILNALKKKFTGTITDEKFSSDSRDFKTQITRILSVAPEIVIINPNSLATGLEILKELKTFGYTGPVFGNFFGGSSDVVGSKYAEKMIYFADPVVTDSELKRKIFAKYLELYHEKLNYEYGAAASFDALNIIGQAISSVGTNPEMIKDYVSRNKFEGLLGRYSFKDGNLVGSSPVVSQIVGGKSIPYIEK